MAQLEYLVITPSLAKVYQKDQEKSDYPGIEPPYLAALTAGFIRQQGYDAKILDSNALGLTLEETLNRIREYNPKLLHIVVMGNQPSASSQLMNTVGTISNGVKETLNTKILLTGTHPAALPQETLRDGFGDFVGDGEGYFTALGLLKGTLLSQVPGLWYKDNGQVRRSDIRDLPIPTERLSEVLPAAAWDLLPMEKYRAHDWQGLGINGIRQPYGSVYTSFGCPFKCSFCCINSINIGGGVARAELRWRDPEQVADEMKMLVDKYGIRLFKLSDEMFVFREEHYVPLAKELVKRKIGEKATIWAYARVDTVKEGHLDLLKSAGFDWICLGIESGSKHVRHGSIKGKFGDDDIRNVVQTIKNHGIYVLGNFIYGLPDEGMEEMQQTLDLANELICERSNLYCVMPYPGSRLHEWGRATRQILQEQGKKGVEFVRNEWEKHKQEVKEKKKRVDDFHYLPLPHDWNPERPLLPEDSPGGWLGYSQHAYECWPLPTFKVPPEEIIAFRDSSLRKHYLENEAYGKMLHETFGKKNTPEALENFRQVNAKTPKRMILGHKKD